MLENASRGGPGLTDVTLLHLGDLCYAATPSSAR